jgi:hypothetical protein
MFCILSRFHGSRGFFFLRIFLENMAGVGGFVQGEGCGDEKFGNFIHIAFPLKPDGKSNSVPSFRFGSQILLLQSFASGQMHLRRQTAFALAFPRELPRPNGRFFSFSALLMSDYSDSGACVRLSLNSAIICLLFVATDNGAPWDRADNHD